jgi:outer membrane protein OmpA-like peptidoglycan-associated protein
MWSREEFNDQFAGVLDTSMMSTMINEEKVYVQNEVQPRTKDLSTAKARATALGEIHIGIEEGAKKYQYIDKDESIKTEINEIHESIKYSEEHIIKVLNIDLKKEADIIANIIIDSVSNSLYEDFKKKSPQTKKNATKYLNSIKNSKSTEIRELIRKKIKNKVKSLLTTADQEISVIFNREGNVAYKLTEKNANVELHNISRYFWNLHHVNYFETNSYSLDTAQRQALTDNINIFLDTVFTAIVDNTVDAYPDSSIYYNITLLITVHGYADSQGHKDMMPGETKKEKNQKLSENRADEIMEIFLNIYKSRVKQDKNNRIIYMEPEGRSIGRGEELPFNNGYYEPEGKADQRRRTVILECSFNVKKK